MSNRITPFLWFNDQAEEAANFYVSVFSNSRITSTSRYDKNAAQASGQKEGAVMTIGFELDGEKFLALNGGPHFKFSEAISFVITCQDQKEIDYYWNELVADPNGGQCGWLKDRFGLSWQVIPADLPKLISNPGSMKAMFQMKKLDIEALKKAATS
jgi:predicted 3-demethylubiquinone-9 3-methyltransferase (glyoxalase superfamily)